MLLLVLGIVLVGYVGHELLNREDVVSVVITNQRVRQALSGSDWDFGNKVLYDMCKRHPLHDESDKVIAKVWLIGRSYAAAIERRKEIEGNEFEGDDFYLERVAPMILNSEIDDWFQSLKSIRSISDSNLEKILFVHFKVMDLFSDISGLEKRSLASKYLHFHFPKLFFIYDSRAARAIASLSHITGRVGRSKYLSDNEYRKFCEKCLVLRDYIQDSHNVEVSPRTLDNLLLSI